MIASSKTEKQSLIIPEEIKTIPSPLKKKYTSSSSSSLSSSSSSSYCFKNIETLPGLKDEHKARQILTELANDPGTSIISSISINISMTISMTISISISISMTID